MQAFWLSSKGAGPQGASVLSRRTRLLQPILVAVNAPLMVVAVRIFQEILFLSTPICLLYAMLARSCLQPSYATN